jgi:hypothetical protein
MTVAGTWNLTIKTPIGRQEVVLELVEVDGALHGTAIGAQETVPLVDPVLTGDQLTWRQSITKPMRLDLAFDLTVAGDSMTGTSRAGRLPRSKVTATRSG